MDIISFNEAATANSRIESFIENPDSTSGIVTVPKVIASGETITVPEGRVAVLPNVQVDGTLNVDGEVFVPSGATFGDLESQIALKADTSYVNNKYSGFKNYIINGGFDVWQRGTSFASSGYTADRWRAYNNTNITRWNYPNTASGFMYACNVKFNGAYCGIEQRIENGYLFKNREVTLSYSLRTITPTTGSYLFYKFKKISDGSTINGGLIASGFNNTTMSGYEYRSITFTPIYTGTAINNTDIMLEISFIGSGATSESGEFNITGVQLEEGSVATPFEKRPYGLELSLCQRYYQSYTNLFAGGYNSATTRRVGIFSFITEMRTLPTIDFSNITYQNATNLSITGITSKNFIPQLTISTTNNYAVDFRASLDAEL